MEERFIFLQKWNIVFVVRLFNKLIVLRIVQKQEQCLFGDTLTDLQLTSF